MPILDPVKKSHSATAQLIHENLQRLRRTQRCNRGEMQKVQGQEPALEETRNREVIAFIFFTFLLGIQALKQCSFCLCYRT